MEKLQQGPYVATRLYDGFWAIDQNYVRSFLIEGSERSMLVDSCDADADLAGLVAELTNRPVFLVQTHCDHDHIAASHQFSEVYMHASEFALLRETAGANLFDPRPMREGDVFDLGGRRFEVLLLPGHTPGSIALLDRQNRLLLSGDSVKGDIVYMFGPGRDLDAYADSLRRLYEMRADYDDILPCHGPLPLTADCIPDLIEGAQKLRRGELAGVDDGCGMPCLLYSYKTAHFYY